MVADACVRFLVDQQVGDLLERVAHPLLRGQVPPRPFYWVPTFKDLLASGILGILQRLFRHGREFHIVTKLFLFWVCFILAPDLKVWKEEHTEPGQYTNIPAEF